MKIASFIKESYQEYFNECSLVLFCTKCNFFCKGCYNRFRMREEFGVYDSQKVIMENVNPLHTGIVFLGGECTLHSDLLDDLQFVKKFYPKLKTKIFTNGTNYCLIEKILKHPKKLLDCVSMDVKAVHDVQNILQNNLYDDETYKRMIESMVNLLCEYHIPLELRTTHTPFIDEQHLQWIKDFVRYLAEKNNLEYRCYNGNHEVQTIGHQELPHIIQPFLDVR